MPDLIGEIRDRDALKGHSPAGATMTQAEADRRTLLRLLDAAREELADAIGRVDRLTDRVIAAEEKNQDTADLAAENAELRRQLADTPTTEAPIAKLREWVPDYEAGATHVAMPVATARRLLDAASARSGSDDSDPVAADVDPDEYVPCPRHGTRCFREIPDLAQRIECAIGLGERGIAGVKATAEQVMMMVEDHVLAELADVDAELGEARSHNDATCTAVAERDQARTRIEAVDALLTSGPIGHASGERYIRADLIREALDQRPQYPAPADNRTLGSDQCPRCGGGNTRPWDVCADCDAALERGE